jgi:hypothetical protein
VKEPGWNASYNEVRLAVEKTYKILETYEVYRYQVTQYNPETNEGGLFVERIPETKSGGERLS